MLNVCCNYAVEFLYDGADVTDNAHYLLNTNAVNIDGRV